MTKLHLKILVITLSFFCLALFSGCSKDISGAASPRGGANASNLPPRQVNTVNSESRRLTKIVSAPGTLAADEQATLSFKVAGRLNDLKVDLGSQVRKGQLIGQLETTDFKGRLQQAEASLQQARVRLGLQAQGDNDQVETENTALVRQVAALLEEAKLNLERTKQLVKQGIQSKAELDRVESAYKVADSRYQDAVEEVRNRQAVLLQRRSELALARQQLAETSLYAAFDGAVRERRASLGEYLAAGSPVVTIVRLHPLRLKLEAPERDAQGIRTGQSVRVIVQGEEGQEYSGHVARISPAFQEQSRTLIIEAEVDNQQGKLRPGSFAKAEIQTTSTADVVMVPTSAIVTFAGIQKVFTVKDGKAVEKTVVLGRQEKDWVVVEGLGADLPVIVSPGNLVSGQAVILGK
jgi:RND family efflux transporter MFP subunit